MNVKEAFVSRRSVRRFLPDSVSKEKIENILEGAAFAPSGHNIQPWHVYVVQGQKKLSITQSIIDAIKDGSSKNMKTEFDYYPTEWFEPFVSRRRAVGFELYKLLEIGRDDFEARDKQMQENFHFFGAPVGMFITMDKRLATGTFMDVGMFIQSILVGARGEGLHSCGQVAFTKFHTLIAEQLEFKENEMLVCGVSIGYEDTSAAENALRVEKLQYSDFTTFLS
ncbi:MAG: nitroreductase [Candidatus Puniceispirillales bacterium]|jgi:nitroreductase|tara:strand:- start:12 stop:683 length:672 start_codon:yes stop_codon:yes gene_type:complete